MQVDQKKDYKASKCQILKCQQKVFLHTYNQQVNYHFQISLELLKYDKEIDLDFLEIKINQEVILQLDYLFLMMSFILQNQVVTHIILQKNEAIIIVQIKNQAKKNLSLKKLFLNVTILIVIVTKKFLTAVSNSKPMTIQLHYYMQMRMLIGVVIFPMTNHVIDHPCDVAYL